MLNYNAQNPPNAIYPGDVAFAFFGTAPTSVSVVLADGDDRQRRAICDGGYVDSDNGGSSDDRRSAQEFYPREG